MKQNHSKIKYEIESQKISKTIEMLNRALVFSGKK